MGAYEKNHTTWQLGQLGNRAAYTAGMTWNGSKKTYLIFSTDYKKY